MGWLSTKGKSEQVPLEQKREDLFSEMRNLLSSRIERGDKALSEGQMKYMFGLPTDFIIVEGARLECDRCDVRAFNIKCSENKNFDLMISREEVETKLKEMGFTEIEPRPLNVLNTLPSKDSLNKLAAAQPAKRQAKVKASTKPCSDEAALLLAKGPLTQNPLFSTDTQATPGYGAI